MIQVETSAGTVVLEPGGTAQLTVTVTNDQEHDDHFFLEIEGIDVEWYALPVPSLTVERGKRLSANVLFRAPRTSSSLAGSYPFVVRAKSMETGETGFRQATLEIKPFHDLQIDIAPRRAVASFFSRAANITVTVSNLSNHDETLELFGSDAEDACTFEFETDRVSLKPGHTETISMRVEPATRPIVGGSRLFGYSVTARSTNDAYVYAGSHAQLDRRALLSTISIIVLSLALAVGIGIYLMTPKPALLHSFTANPRQVVEGEEVTLSWDASHLDAVTLLPDGQNSNQATGSFKVRPEQTTKYTLVARFGGGREKRESVTVVVIPRPIALPPRIVFLNASPKKIHLGETVNLSWSCENTKSVMLNPNGSQKDWPMYKAQTDRPDRSTTYELVAQGMNGRTTSRTVVVEVVHPLTSISTITSFKATPEKFKAGEPVTLSWTTENATKVEFEHNLLNWLPSNGKLVVNPKETTTYTLRAYDSKENFTPKVITLTPTPAEPVIDKPEVKPGDGTGTPNGVGTGA